MLFLLLPPTAELLVKPPSYSTTVEYFGSVSEELDKVAAVSIHPTLPGSHVLYTSS
jgi:hypothetical protein